MDEDGLPLVGFGVDLLQVEAIKHRRTLAYVNYFLASTSSFINHFATTCEKKLADVSFRLQRLEITVSILENKLNSIPGLDDVTAAAYVSTTQTPTVNAPTAAAPAAKTNATAAAPTAAAPTAAAAAAPPPPSEPEAPTAPPTMTVRQDSRFAKYFKMMDMGVPAPAVAMKFANETGMDPRLLDNPDAPAPADGGGSGGAASRNDDSDESEVASDFSDTDKPKGGGGGGGGGGDSDDFSD